MNLLCHCSFSVATFQSNLTFCEILEICDGALSCNSHVFFFLIVVCFFVFERTSHRPKTVNDIQVTGPGDVMFLDGVLISNRQDKQIKDWMHGN